MQISQQICCCLVWFFHINFRIKWENFECTAHWVREMKRQKVKLFFGNSILGIVVNCGGHVTYTTHTFSSNLTIFPFSVKISGMQNEYKNCPRSLASKYTHDYNAVKQIKRNICIFYSFFCSCCCSWCVSVLV